MSNLASRFALTLVLSLLLLGRGVSDESKYFPETGKAAIHQRALDLRSGAVVLQLALQPGYEDMSLLAHVRLGIGARSVVAYATNGDATPADNRGTAPVFVAAERKEEAYKAATLLGATAHFLNLPDPGIVGSREILRQIWDVDTARARLERTIRYFRPDVVVVTGDFRGDTIQSLRQNTLTELLLEAVRSASRDTVVSDTVRAPGWSVARVYVESGRGGGNRERTYDQLHMFWKKPYRAIAREAAEEYHSLRLQLGSWMAQGDRRYKLIFHRGTLTPRSMLEGLPVLGPRLRRLGSMVRKVASRETGGLRSPTLSEVSRTVDTLDVVLARNRSSFLPEDMRLLAGWKNGLEELRCSLLDVRLDYACSDSLTTESQLLFLKFRGMTSRTIGGRNWVLFPSAIHHVWGINESREYQFTFMPPQEFRIITPKKMEMTIPGSQFGMTQTSMRTRFSFLVMHQDSLRERNFFYRGEVPLRVGPRRTQEVITPVVRAIDGEGVLYRLLNLSRDAYAGTMSIVDSFANRVSKKVSLPEKDYLLLDTLLLSLRKPLPPGDYPMTLDLSGGDKQVFIARSFEAAVDSQARIGLLSSIENSPIAQATERLRLTLKKIDGSLDVGTDLSMFNVIVIDRDALAGSRDFSNVAAVIRDWVRRGGHLVVLPQISSAGGGASFISGVSFRTFPQLPPEAAVEVDTTWSLSGKLNQLRDADWDEWVVARSLCSVNVLSGQRAQVLVRARHDNIPLVVEIQEGAGRITLVALDLVSQLLNVHPGAHRLLANLLGTH